MTSRPSTLVVIPARGGSKGISGKNLQLVGGRSLVGRAVDSSLAAEGVDKVIVSTDDDEIAVVAARHGARIVERPAELAGDTASSESAVVHVLSELDQLPSVTVLVQATSPFIDPSDLSRAVELVRSGAADVAFAVTRADEFLWRDGPNGPTGVNHDHRFRPRRQDRAVEYRETGAFYALRTDGFLTAGHRFFGRLAFVEVDGRSALEIDEPHHLEQARLLASDSVLGTPR